MRDIIITVFVIGMVPRILVSAYVGVLMWTWLAYMMPHTLAWGFAQSIPFSQIVAISVLLSVLISKEPKRIPWSPVVVGLVVFNLWMLITTSLAFYPDEAWAYESKTFKAQLMNFITMMFVTSYQRIKGLIWVLVLSIGFYLVKGGVFAIMTGGKFQVMGPEGSYLGNNTMGLTAAMMVPIIRFLQIDDHRKWVKNGLSFMMVCSVLVSAASYSRGAVLAAAAMGGFLWLKSGKNKLPMAVAVVLVGGMVYSLMPDSWLSRMNTVKTYDKDSSAMGRVNAWWMSWNFSKDHPIFGGGFGVGGSTELFRIYAPVPTDIHDFHSIYFSLLAHQGFPGVFLYLSIIVMAWRTASRIIKISHYNNELAWAGNLAAMVQVSIIGYLVGGAFLNLAYWDLPYLLISILVITEEVVHRHGTRYVASEGEFKQSNTRIKSFVQTVEH